MSERERWIVYPLLFLALGAGLRDKLIDQTMSKRIVCQELIVYGEDNGLHRPVELVKIGAAPRASTTSPQVGQIRVRGLLHADAVSADTVSANNFVYRGRSITPNVSQAISPTDWMRALQRAKALQDAAQPDKPASGQSVPSSQQSSTADEST